MAQRTGARHWQSRALEYAVGAGYLEAAKRLIKHDPKVPVDMAYDAVWEAYSEGHRILLAYLLDQGFPPSQATRNAPPF